MTRDNWYKHINWLNVVLIIGVPIYGLAQAWWTTLQWKTGLFAVAYYFMTGLGITAGKSGDSSPPPPFSSLAWSANPTGKATIDCGLTRLTRPLSRFESLSQLWVVALSRVP